MSADAKRALAGIDELVTRGRRRDRMTAARLAAIESGHDPELAAAAAAVERRRPLRLAGQAEPPGVHDGEQNPVVRARIERIQTAMKAGRVTPAESVRFYEAMSADEAAATKLLAEMPEGRIPLEPRAECPDPENPIGPGPLSDSMSLLSRAERAELAARRPT